MVEGTSSNSKDGAQLKKFASAKHNAIQPAPTIPGLPQVNRPPSTASSKITESPAKSFNFNVQGQAALSTGVKGVSHTIDKSSAHSIPPPGKGINLAGTTTRIGAGEQSSAEEDERYKYLLKHGIVKKLEDENKIIFAELPQIPGVLVVYRKPSERNANPERLNLDRRELTHMPLLEGEERLRLLNLQHNYVTKIENLVSLPNLIFLDLYNNEIKEISHLHTVPTLRVLMLGKNHIERIRNLQSLTKLDVLDLHSNRISKIENLNHLSELRVLNLANNLITTVDNLTGLASLTELNLRRSAIEMVSGLAACPRLQRLFLSNNRIAKFENIASVADAQQLTELALDGNPIAASPLVYYKFCLNSCPHIKHIDLKKVTPEFKAGVEEGKLDDIIKAGPQPTPSSGESSITPTDANTKAGKDKGIAEDSPEKRDMEKAASESSDYRIDLAAVSLDPAKEKDKPIGVVTTKVASVPANPPREEQKAAPPARTVSGDEQTAAVEPSGAEITPENLVKVISQEWKLELERLRSKNANGMRKKKDARSDSLVQSGHAEIEGDTMLFIYGNALEVLGNQEFQKTVEQISFQYMKFDSIMDHISQPKLRKFQKLNKLSFSHNYLHSFVQVSRLESLPHLTSLTIEHNELMRTALSKSFIVYRFPRVNCINGAIVAEIDRLRSRRLFRHFDALLSSPPFFTKKSSSQQSVNNNSDKDKDLGESAERTAANRTQRQISKNNIEATQIFLGNMVGQSLALAQKAEKHGECWDSAMETLVVDNLQEITGEEFLTERNMRKIVNL